MYKECSIQKINTCKMFSVNIEVFRINVTVIYFPQMN